jgi:Protein of unknown function (DUF3443)
VNLFSTGDAALNDVGGTIAGSKFDFGLPFFFGRNVYSGIAGQSPSPIGGNPYYAY